MASVNKAIDVFISHGPADTALAHEIANACRGLGLETVSTADVTTHANAGEELWDALAESNALVTIISPSGPTSAMFIDIGAARAWNKPIYPIVTDPGTARLPTPLIGTRLYTVGRLQDVLSAIQASEQEFTELDRTNLIQCYQSMHETVDRLAADSRQLDKLVRLFTVKAGKSYSGERLLSELFRLRKQAKLPRMSVSRRPRASN